jgi:hypothetical protein
MAAMVAIVDAAPLGYAVRLVLRGADVQLYYGDEDLPDDALMAPTSP